MSGDVALHENEIVAPFVTHTLPARTSPSGVDTGRADAAPMTSLRFLTAVAWSPVQVVPFSPALRYPVKPERSPVSVTDPVAEALLAEYTRVSLTPDAAPKVPSPVTVAEQVQFRALSFSPMLSRSRAPLSEQLPPVSSPRR